MDGVMNEYAFIGGIFIALGLLVLSLFSYYEILMPSRPMYISSNLFPIIVNTSNYTSSQSQYAVYVFNGIKQANNTECISNVKIYTYAFNYTSQKYQMVWNESVTNPTQVHNIYNNVSYIIPITSPKRYASLCQSVINNTS